MLKTALQIFETKMILFNYRFINTCLALLLLGEQHANAADSTTIRLGRLFTTEAERRIIESYRSAQDQTAFPPTIETIPDSDGTFESEPKVNSGSLVIHYQGSLSISGQVRVWINHTLIDPETYPDVLYHDAKTNELLINTQTSNQWIALKPGYEFDSSQSVIRDSLKKINSRREISTDVASSRTLSDLTEVDFTPAIIDQLRSLE